MWRKNSAVSSNLPFQWIHAERSRFSVFKVLRGKWKTSTVDIIVELNLCNILSYQYWDAGREETILIVYYQWVSVFLHKKCQYFTDLIFVIVIFLFFSHM